MTGDLHPRQHDPPRPAVETSPRPGAAGAGGRPGSAADGGRRRRAGAVGRRRTAVVTITHRRDGHLHRQRLGLVADPPEVHVVVGMADHPDVALIAGAPAVTHRHVTMASGGLPLAAARNAGARAALDAGADVIVFLDVDCIPGPHLVSRYAAAVLATAPPATAPPATAPPATAPPATAPPATAPPATAAAAPSPALLCGPVSYLPAPPLGGYPGLGPSLAGGPSPVALGSLAAPHPGRPAPADGQLVAESRFDLFWSLSFAVSARTWTDLGGFHEGYVGYGAEDTDFARGAAAAGARLFWVGGADAYHQYHPPSRREPRHVREMIGNARLFHSRHGSWPMLPWLAELAADGVVEFDPGAGVLRLA